MRLIFLFCTFLINFPVFSQEIYRINQIKDEEEKIKTELSQISLSASTKTKKKFQIETGFSHINNINTPPNELVYLYNNTLLKYGILKNFEIRTQIAYKGVRKIFKKDNNTDSIVRQTDMSPLNFSTKFKIFTNRKGNFEISGLCGIDIPLNSSSYISPKNVTPSLILLIDQNYNNVNLKFNIGLKFKDGIDEPNGYYSLQILFDISEKISFGFEPFGYFGSTNNNYLDLSANYEIFKRFKISAFGGISINQVTINDRLNYLFNGSISYAF